MQKGYVFDPKQQQLRGVSFASSSDVTATDSILTAIGKLQAKFTVAGTGPFVRTAGDTPLTGNWNVGGFSLLNLNNLTIGVATPTAVIDVSQNMSSPAWITNGTGLRWRASTYTDTSSSGVVADMNIHIFAAATVAASSVTTYTNVYGFTVTTPIAGSNVTFTNPYAFRSNGVARFDSSITALGNINFFGGTRTIQTGDSNILQFGTSGTVRGLINATTTAWTIGATPISGNPTLGLSVGTRTAAAWTTAGVGFVHAATTFTDSSSSGTVAAQYVNVFSTPTIAASSSTTYTLSATQFIAGPAAGTNVTQSNTAALVLGGHLYFNTGNTATFGTYDSQNLTIKTNNTDRIFILTDGRYAQTEGVRISGTSQSWMYTQANHTGGAIPGYLWTAGTLTGQTASTEIIDQHWNNAAILTRAAGTVSLQRGSIITGRTYAFASSSTITLASTFDVVQSIAGTNATISTNYAQRWVNDANNYVGINISSIGLVTYTAVGTSNPGFVWNQFAVFNGSLTTATTTGNASVYFAAQNSTTNNTTQAELNIAGTGTMYARWWNRGSVNYTPAANGNYGSYVMGQQAVTIAGSGTHSLFAQAIFRPLSITPGAGTLTNSSTVYIENASTGATNNYALWVDDGPVRIDGVLSIGNTVNAVSPTAPNRTVAMSIGGTTYYLHAKTTND
jgi:hypothetical protein